MHWLCYTQHMANETTKFLGNRAEVLQKTLEVYRAKIQPLEAELADVRRALNVLRGDHRRSVQSTVASVLTHRSSPYHRMTLKSLIKKALREQFPRGATANELVDFFENAWDREVQRTSLSPQLSRLKDEGVVVLEDTRWTLVKHQTVQPEKEMSTRTIRIGSTKHSQTEEENRSSKPFFLKSSTQTSDKDPS